MNIIENRAGALTWEKGSGFEDATPSPTPQQVVHIFVVVVVAAVPDLLGVARGDRGLEGRSDEEGLGATDWRAYINCE